MLILFLVLAIVFSLVTAAMWAMWLLGRGGPTVGDEFRTCRRFSIYSGLLWLAFIVAALAPTLGSV